MLPLIGVMARASPGVPQRRACAWGTSPTADGYKARTDPESGPTPNLDPESAEQVHAGATRDSKTMKVLQTLVRIYLSPEALDPSLAFYEGLFRKKCRLRFVHSAARLELAQVGNVLLLAGAEEALRPFRSTATTFVVDDLAEFREFLVRSGATILSDAKDVPTGRNMRVRHPDDLVVEYVQFDQQQRERMESQR